ncbi:MAG: AAA family ATPase [Chitinivibrionales bacterium]|nr:AAA family ATPase [Chitinivibrionales bacterium]
MTDQASLLRAMVATPQAPLKTDGAATLPFVPSGVHKSISITSGKGGVGKTTVSLGLAFAIAAGKKKVLLLDADLGLANVHIALGIAPRFNISHVVAGQCALEEVIVKGPQGIAILPGASGLETLANIDAARLGRLLRQLALIERNYDVLVVDTAAGISSTTTEFAGSADVALVVVTPEPTSMADAYAMIKVLSRRDQVSIRVVINMAKSEQEGVQIFDRLNALVVKFIQKPLACAAIVPFDGSVQKALKQQQAGAEMHRISPFQRGMHTLAQTIVGMPPPVSSAGGFFARFFKNIK